VNILIISSKEPKAPANIFDEPCFLDLEDAQGQMIGHTPHDILSHIYTANVEEEDHDDEIIEIEEKKRDKIMIQMNNHKCISGNHKYVEVYYYTYW
jgi:hypothetical protein